MSKKTQNQIDQELERERLTVIAERVYELLGEEDVGKAMDILKYCESRIQQEVVNQSRKRKLKDLWQKENSTKIENL